MEDDELFVTPEEMRKHIEYATAIVKTWPKWKQNILQDSLKPTVDVPRKPVINSDYDYW